MSFPARLHDMITIQTWAPDEVDIYGDEQPAFVQVNVRALVQQASASEDDVDRETRVTEYTVFLEPDVTISAKDRVILAGGTQCEVIGDPDVVADGIGPHHIEARIRSVEG